VKLRTVLSLVVVTALAVGWPIVAGASWTIDPGAGRASFASSQLLAPRTPLGPPKGSWPVYHRDNAHTGYDPSLPDAVGITTGWTSVGADQEIFASPLVNGGLVYAATLNNSVYAFNQIDGSVYWSKNLRAPQVGGWSCGNMSQQGILGTPVVDPITNRIFVVTLSGVDNHYRLEGLNLLTGAPEITTDISQYIGAAFDWHVQQQRGALAIANGNVYVPFGGRWGDCGNYHGWVFAVPTNGNPITSYYVTPGRGSGFWAAGGVAVDDSTGKVFVTSGNGTNGCNANPDGSPVLEENAVVRLSATLAHEDAFVPQDWRTPYCTADQDLGGAGPLLMSPSLLFQAGKAGGGFLLNPNSLGGLDGQLFPTPKPQPYVQADVCAGNHGNATFGSFAYAAPFIYLECDGGRGIVALNVDTTVPSFVPCTSTSCGSPNWRGGVGLTFGPPIVAGGLVWAASDGNGMYAFRADNGTQVFKSANFGINRFSTPAEAGGEIYVASHFFIRQFVMTFGIAQSGAVPAPPRDSVLPAPPPAAPTRQGVNQSSPMPAPIGR
jgi:outer membrane protein assembly factor BamB